MFERILIVDDDEPLRTSLSLVLAAEGYELVTAADGEQALELIEEGPIDAILCDLRMPGIDGFDLIPQLARKRPGAPIILISAHASDDLAIEAMKRGAYDYLAKPFQPSEVLLTLRKANERERLRRANQLLQREVDRVVGDKPIVAASESMIELLELLERTAGFKTTALLEGECGTGKEALARAIHAQSPRRDRPFIAVNCTSSSDALLDSELFGHVRSTTAGAETARRGLFAEAHEGTIFLDEVGALSPTLQAKLLRVIQDEEIRPAGEDKAQAVDVRILAATSRDLSVEVREKRFREDLYYRLNVVHLPVPPLRQRREDIPLLVDHFVARFQSTLGKPLQGIADDALDRLMHYAWPGNVRELENVIERATILANDRITLHELPTNVAAASATDPGAGLGDFSLRRARRAFEAQMIRRALLQTEGNRTHAAKLLEISHRALLYKIKEYGLRDGS